MGTNKTDFIFLIRLILYVLIPPLTTIHSTDPMLLWLNSTELDEVSQSVIIYLASCVKYTDSVFRAASELLAGQGTFTRLSLTNPGQMLHPGCHPVDSFSSGSYHTKWQRRRRHPQVMESFSPLHSDLDSNQYNKLTHLLLAASTWYALLKVKKEN